MGTWKRSIKLGLLASPWARHRESRVLCVAERKRVNSMTFFTEIKNFTFALLLYDAYVRS